MSFLYDPRGNRKYLTAAERSAFLLAAGHLPPVAESFCRVLAYTGARVSEALALSPEHIDVDADLIVIQTLKRRRSGVFRSIPVPVELLQYLESVHGIAAAHRDPVQRRAPIWTFRRTTAWSIVKQAMVTAGIEGPRASPKGLRHAFAVSALQTGVPITMVRKWLGHARLTTTEIYVDVVGAEERAIAVTLWRAIDNGSGPGRDMNSGG